MMDMKKRIDRESDDAFIVDARYLQNQANEAISTFLMPLKGLYRAAVGKPSRVRMKKRRSA